MSTLGKILFATFHRSTNVDREGIYEDSWSLASLFSSLSAIYQEVYRQARQRNLSIEKEESTQSHDQWLT